MPRPLAAFAVLLLCSLAAACASATHAPEYTPSLASTIAISGGQPPLRTITVDIAGTAITLEVADDPPERTAGLSGRTRLADNTGMLFVFETEGAHSLWMKGMLFPLDFVWLDSAQRVVEITSDVPTQPGVADSALTLYRPQAAVRYAIELDAGEAARLGIEVEDVVEFTEGAD